MGALEDSKKYLPGWRCEGICENCHGWCSFALVADTALKAIQQLERERDAAVESLRGACSACRHNKKDDVCFGCKWGYGNPGEDRWEWLGVCPDTEVQTRRAEDCRYYTANCFWGAGCLGTKEIDPCEGDGCERWKAKEDAEK